MNAIQQYFGRLSKGFGEGWNRFWFTPSDPLTVCVLRVVAGAAALFYVVSYTVDLTDWFGPNGWLPVATVQGVMETSPGEGAAYQWSYLNYIESSGALWAAHMVGIAVVALFALGLFTRVTSVLALVVVLSYIHRAPLIAAQFEPVLAMLIFYLCFTPCGRRLSLDSRFRKKPSASMADSGPERFWSATVGLRLIQVHVAGLYLMMGLAKLGAETWWEGGALWWLMAQPQSRIVDLTFIRNQLLLINAWTHATVLFELTFGILIWNQLARPLLIALSFIMWPLMAVVTGLLPFCLLMIALGAAFVPAKTWRSLLGPSRADAVGGIAKSEGKKEAASAVA